MNTITINFTPCTPAPANGYKVSYRPVGTSIPYRVAPANFTSSPAVIVDSNDPDGTQYEGFIESDCGGGNFGVPVPFSTSGGNCANVTGLQIVSITETSVTLTWNTVPTAVAYTIYAVRVSDGFQMGNSTGGNPPRSYTGLTAGTEYKFYVKTHCQNGGTSSGIFVQATTPQQQSAYFIEVTQTNQFFQDMISCGCGNNPLPYDHSFSVFHFRAKDSNTGQYVSSLPSGTVLSGTFRRIGTDAQGNPVDVIENYSLSGANVSFDATVQNTYSYCDDGYQSCLDYHIVAVDENYLLKEFTGNVPVKANLIVNDWSNAYQQGGNGGWQPAQSNTGFTDIRGLMNIELTAWFFDNIILFNSQANGGVYIDKFQPFYPIAAGTKFYTDALLTVPLTGYNTVTIWAVGNNTNVYGWWTANLNPASGEVL